MTKEETLLKIKETEADVRRSLDGILEERERLLRAARRESLELRDRLRGEAEARFEAILKEAEVAISRERDTLLAGGRKEAAAMKARADANLERAVDRLIEKFKGALNA